MSRTCTICAHPDRAAIDTALIGGEAVRAVASRYVTNGRPLGRMAMQRHKDEHLPAVLVKAKEVEEVTRGLDVVKQLRTINGVTMQILSEARQRKDPEVALKAIDRIQKQIELQAKLLGDLDERPVVNILVSDDWLRLRATIIAALAAHPEAQRAVVGALSANGGRESGANR